MHPLQFMGTKFLPENRIEPALEIGKMDASSGVVEHVGPVLEHHLLYGGLRPVREFSRRPDLHSLSRDCAAMALSLSL